MSDKVTKGKAEPISRVGGAHLAPAGRPPSGERRLLAEIRSLIEASRQHTARVVNSAMAITYWSIGERIGREVLADDRGEYGKQVVERLADRLATEYGSGFSRRNLFNMVRVARAFPDAEIVQTMSAQLGWSHLVVLTALDDSLRREFYAQMCMTERWSVRTLQQKIQGMLFERTAISRKPEILAAKELQALRNEDRMSADLVFRDQYVLDFLRLKDAYDERDLETAILREIEGFIAELGTDFAFVGRQKRMTVDGVDYRLDLLFFHRRLRRLIAIDLKLGRFQAADKGQMELYLRWLQKYEQRPGEESPLGLILCAGKSEEHVELLQLEKSGIRVAEYITELPPREILEQKLHTAITAARRRMESQLQVLESE
ncbi:MAG TPA: PDDEXK nuclease domain-containing protein [Longimicrobium sp.]|jgi:predicted nuclease of restriction endonuclease-like (RecB) superfamily